MDWLRLELETSGGWVPVRYDIGPDGAPRLWLTSVDSGIGIWLAMKEGYRLRRRSASPSKSAWRRLDELYRRNGYVRRADGTRIASEGWERYKKGEEVRLVAATRSELSEIRRLLRQVGFRVGRPFVKGRQLRQPIYGKDQVARFLAAVETQLG